MLKRLRIQFIAIIMALLTLLLGSVIGLIYHFTRQSLVKGEPRHDGLARRQPRSSWPGLDEASNRVNLPYCMLQVNKYGEILATNGGYYDLSDEDFLQELIAVTYSSTDMQGEIPQYHLRYSRYLLQNGQRLVFVDTTSEQATLHALLRSSLLLGAAALLLFFGVSLLLARRTVQPVEAAWQQQKQFVADASHELKTPLTVIMTNAELLESPDYPPEAKTQFSSNILTMSHQMRGLVESLLNLARIDQGQKAAVHTPVDLSKLVSDATLPFEALFFEQELTLETEIAPDLTVPGDAAQLRQVVEILLDNAQKYAEAPGTVRVTLARQGHHVRLCVADTGAPPLPRGLQKHLQALLPSRRCAQPRRQLRSGSLHRAVHRRRAPRQDLVRECNWPELLLCRTSAITKGPPNPFGGPFSAIQRFLQAFQRLFLDPRHIATRLL